MYSLMGTVLWNKQLLLYCPDICFSVLVLFLRCVSHMRTITLCYELVSVGWDVLFTDVSSAILVCSN
jgi:hypothetical protein